MGFFGKGVPHLKRRNRGQILVLFALALVVLIGLAALGVDVGYMYSVRHELQRCADAGALAGASYFRDTGYWSSTPGDPKMAVAEARARTFATKDKVITSPLDNTEVFVSFSSPPIKPPENYKIYVGTQRTVNFFFSRLFLGPTKLIKAYAVAEAFPVTEKVTCVVPWGIPAPWVDNDGNGIWSTGDQFDWPRTPQEWQAYNEDHCLGTNTGWTVYDDVNHVYHQVDGSGTQRDNFLCQGSLQVLKIGDPSSQIIPGNFFGMDFSSILGDCPPCKNNSGADLYSCLIKHSCECDLKVSTNDDLPVDTKTGNMVGPTIKPIAPDKYYGTPNSPDPHDYYALVNQGSNWKKDTLPSGFRDATSLMNGDPNAVWVNTSDGGYPQGIYDWFKNGVPATGDWAKSSRVIRIPIYDPSGTIDGGIHTPGKSGKTSFQPLGFMGFWIQDIQYQGSTSGTIVGRYITVGGWGGSGPDPGPSGTPVLNIRLVE
jgi:hypothetical protein